MANTDYGMAAIQIEILVAFIIPNIRSFGFDNCDFIDWINVK